MKEQWKICKNPDCRKKFHREERHNHYQWNRIAFHNRECQVNMYNKKRRGKRTHRFKNAINFQSLHDCCNRYITGARQRLKDEVIIYSSKDMTQEELQELVSSVE